MVHVGDTMSTSGMFSTSVNNDPQCRDEKTRKHTVNFHVTILLKPKPRLTPFRNSTHYIYTIKITTEKSLHEHQIRITLHFTEV